MIVVFWLYAVAVAAITVVPTRVHPRHPAPWWVVIEVVPGQVPPASFALNVVMFVPLGLLVPLLAPRTGTLVRLTGLAFAASAVIESTQLMEWLVLGNVRTVDVNDLIANTAGGLLGLLLLRLIRAARHGCSRRASSRRSSPPPAGSASRRRGWR